MQSWATITAQWVQVDPPLHPHRSGFLPKERAYAYVPADYPRASHQDRGRQTRATARNPILYVTASSFDIYTNDVGSHGRPFPFLLPPTPYLLPHMSRLRTLSKHVRGSAKETEMGRDFTHTVLARGKGQPSRRAGAVGVTRDRSIDR